MAINTIPTVIAAPWYERPLPFPVFSALNLASPAILPLFALLASSYFYIHRETDRLGALSDTNFTDPLHYDVYDFIVIGGGSAGSVVASRLSNHNRVLLLEAGGNPHPISIVPMGLLALLSQPGVDWQYETEPQKFAALGLKGQQVPWARAKSLGGCSTINGVIYMRGSPKDFDNWANITRDESWSYKNLLPLFKNLEDYEGNFPNKSHGNSGPIHVEPLRYAPGVQPLIEAVKQIGYKELDLNSFQHGEGFMATEMTTQNGRRADTYRRFLRPLWRRKNLKISRFSHVIKIHLDRQKSAYGVSYVRHGITKFVRANKEIIVSAGTINSPQLLLLSGIGPRRHLNATGIKCRVNLPVGQNLQDHVGTLIGPITVDGGHAFMMDRNLSISAATDYILNGTGPIAMVPVSVTGKMASSFADPSWPDILMHQSALAVHYGSGPLIRVVEDIVGLKRNFLANYVEPAEGKDAFFNLLSVGRPQSRGQITLRSKDPFDKPLIDPKYYSDPRDAEIMIEGIRKVLNIYGNAPLFKNLNATLANGPIKGCDKYSLGSKKYWNCYIRTFTMTIWHPCCTCRMKSLKNGTYDGVVDSKLRVLKTRNLRVIDASVMPVIPNSNLNIPTIMIGEKGSFMIRQHWADQYLISSQLDHFVSPSEHDRKCFYSQRV